ncbi:MAG: HD family phosphohydrolase [Desulfovibrionaceae bacterium]|nr:HD family phosphohydrolase [Desulfovibrionaceae bacterium]
MPTKEAISLCKTILRNGYDAYIVNAPLQLELHEKLGLNELDIACEPDFETLSKLFPNLERGTEPEVVATWKSDETGMRYRFYTTDVSASSHPDMSLTRLTPHILSVLRGRAPEQYTAVMRMPEFINSDRVIEDVSCGTIRLGGIPELTMRRNYLLGIRALRLAANYDLPVEPATWVAIVQAASRIADYVPSHEFVAEWRKVAAENMWRFIQLLADASILHRLIPEVAALDSLKQNKGKHVDDEQSVFQHTIDCMRYYPEERLHHDWIGVVAVFFMDVGKLYTAQRVGTRWTFFQQHRVGAKVTRKILRRLHFDPEDIDTICGLVRNQFRFQSMMTDRGIRRFLELPDTERLIEVARANIRAQQDGNYTNFNHNLKYLERGELPLQMLEPLLNGNEIMEYTGLPQGPEVGILRSALLNAQTRGEVTTTDVAIAFVRAYASRLEELK